MYLLITFYSQILNATVHYRNYRNIFDNLFYFFNFFLRNIIDLTTVRNKNDSSTRKLLFSQVLDIIIMTLLLPGRCNNEFLLGLYQILGVILKFLLG